VIIVNKLLLKIEITCSLRDSNSINKSSNPISKDIETGQHLGPNSTLDPKNHGKFPESKIEPTNRGQPPKS
jgi:hypothetical protein